MSSMSKRKTIAKRGKRVVTPVGAGKVVDVLALRESVMVELEENGVQSEFMRHELQPWDELEALRKKAESPCQRHPEGGCDCGKKEKVEKREERGKHSKSG
jgi:hypothetical protein